jgi:hypothetical protein
MDSQILVVVMVIVVVAAAIGAWFYVRIQSLISRCVAKEKSV